MENTYFYNEESTKKYFLAIKRGNKDYLPIDTKLTATYNNEPLNTIQGIDSYTSKLTESELIENILEANIVPPDEKFIKFVIIFKEKGNVRELKEGPCFIEDSIFLDSKVIYTFFIKHYQDKIVMNKKYNYLNNKKMSKELEELCYIINNINFFLTKGEKVVIVAFQKVFELNYDELRRLGMYLVKNIIPSLVESEQFELLKKD